MVSPINCKHDWENFGMCLVCRDCQEEKYDRCDECSGKLQNLSDHLCQSCATVLREKDHRLHQPRPASSGAHYAKARRMKRLGSIMWTMLAAAVTFMTSVQLVDRFAGNGEAWSFYAPDIDMTCVVGKDEGQKAMYCVPGDHRVAGVEAGDD